MYGISEPALIKEKEYDLCGKYIDPERDVARIGQHYTTGLTMAKRFGRDHQDYVDKKLVNEAAMLVAILVKNDRLPEAQEAADQLKNVRIRRQVIEKARACLGRSPGWHSSHTLVVN